MTGLIAMSEVMAAAGMTEVLALAASKAFGAWYVRISPLSGALDGFLTGSNAAANAMLLSFRWKSPTSWEWPRKGSPSCRTPQPPT